LSFGTSNFLVSLVFLSVIKAVGTSVTFAIGGTFCVLTLVFVRFVIPETKGRELESISAPQPAVAP
jgi:SP family galactose:H+ symporter-like MFS transporter